MGRIESCQVRVYPRELRERAVRMVAGVRPNYESDWAAITAVAAMLVVGTPETPRTWVRQAQIDTDARRGITTADAPLPGCRQETYRNLRKGP